MPTEQGTPAETYPHLDYITFDYIRQVHRRVRNTGKEDLTLWL